MSLLTACAGGAAQRIRDQESLMFWILKLFVEAHYQNCGGKSTQFELDTE
jgi:hypothetical protein